MRSYDLPVQLPQLHGNGMELRVRVVMASFEDFDRNASGEGFAAHIFSVNDLDQKLAFEALRFKHPIRPQVPI